MKNKHNCIYNIYSLGGYVMYNEITNSFIILSVPVTTPHYVVVNKIITETMRKKLYLNR